MHKKCQEVIWAVLSCSLRFLILDRTKKEGEKSSFSNNCVFNSITGNTRKTGQKRFFQPGDGFFQKFPLTSYILKKTFFWLSQKILVNLEAPLQLQIDDYHTWRNEKTKAKEIFLWKNSFFLKPWFFHQLVRSNRNDDRNCTFSTWILCEARKYFLGSLPN